MITKILVTALIIVAALTFIRYRNREGHQQELSPQSQHSTERRTAMIIAVSLASLTLAISAGIFYSYWQDSHTLFSVQITNSHSGEIQTYHVYRDDINGRSFRTIDGRLIHISDAERMEVKEGTGIGTD